MVGLDGNTIEAFRQLVNNNSTAPARDSKAPTIDAGVTSTQGNILSLHFDEHLAQPQNDAEFNSLKSLLSVYIDGTQIPPADIATVSIKSQDITSVNYESVNNLINIEIQDGIDLNTTLNQNAFQLYVNGVPRAPFTNVTTVAGGLEFQLTQPDADSLSNDDVLEVRYDTSLGAINNGNGQPIDGFSAVLNTDNTLQAPGVGATAGAVNIYLLERQTFQQGQSLLSLTTHL